MLFRSALIEIRDHEAALELGVEETEERALRATRSAVEPEQRRGRAIGAAHLEVERRAVDLDTLGDFDRCRLGCGRRVRGRAHCDGEQPPDPRVERPQRHPLEAITRAEQAPHTRYDCRRITPSATPSAAAIRRALNASPSTIVPISAANTTLVSRSAATLAIAPRSMAQITIA